MLDDMYFQGDKGVPPACPTTGLFAIPFPNVDTDWVVHHSAIEDAHGSSVAEYDVKGGDHGPSISSMVQRDPKKKHSKAFEGEPGLRSGGHRLGYQDSRIECVHQVRHRGVDEGGRWRRLSSLRRYEQGNCLVRKRPPKILAHSHGCSKQVLAQCLLGAFLRFWQTGKIFQGSPAKKILRGKY